MKPLVTEREFFDQCSLFVTEKREQSPEENEKRTYLLVCLSETEGSISSWATIVDPAIPKKAKMENFGAMTWGQQILLRSGEQIRAVIKKSIEEITALHHTAQLLKLPVEKIIKTISESGSAEEAKQTIKTLLQGENNELE